MEGQTGSDERPLSVESSSPLLNCGSHTSRCGIGLASTSLRDGYTDTVIIHNEISHFLL